MKMKEIRNLSENEIVDKIKEFKIELFNLRFQSSMNQLTNPMRIRTTRKIIAKLYTVLTEISKNNGGEIVA